MHLYSLGNNDRGQLGLKDKDLKSLKKNQNRMVEVLNGLASTEVVDAAATQGCSFALSDTGEVSFFGSYGNDTANVPHLIDLGFELDGTKFSSIVAAEACLLGLERPEEFDDNVWMLFHDKTIKRLEMPDNRAVVKVHLISVGPSRAFLVVDVAEPIDNQMDSVSDSASVAH